MQDVYDFFYDVNKLLLERGLHRLDDMLRPAAMSGYGRVYRSRGGRRFSQKSTWRSWHADSDARS